MTYREEAYLNTTALAFLGDAVYETFIRSRVLESGEIHADMLHRRAVRYVRAESQAQVLRKLLPLLTEEETALVKRARNRKSATKPKNADPVDYKLATAFEALVGFLYLSHQEERLRQIQEQAALLAEEGEQR